ncbi:D-beta-hydroxybutyrate dehydrogenase, mitochondrial [Halotydeus destructor]|nr:D-beta-hydroxybutyrate dehydrogenase, mitochondrial [Halotydeus destructor]
MWALVNNAGICIYGEFEWMTSDHIEKQIQVNLVGTIKTTKVFLSLIRQHKGRIINVGSVNGSCGYPGISVYCASKYGIEGFTDVLRYEMSKFDVKVILIRPGDFAKLTGIMAQHDKYAQEMWNEMNEGDRKLYHDYFKVYQKYVSDNYGLTSPKSFGHSTLFDDFEEALLSPSPRYYITVAPVAFRIFFKLLQFISPSVKDSVIEFIISKGVNFNARAYFSD